MNWIENYVSAWLTRRLFRNNTENQDYIKTILLFRYAMIQRQYQKDDSQEEAYAYLMFCLKKAYEQSRYNY